MVKRKKQLLLAGIIIVLSLLIDQVLKIWVKTHFALGEELPLLGDWCKLHFIENEGMAFGISFGNQIGKLLLSIFRVVIVGGLIYYVWKLIRKGTANSLVISVLALIIAGALGNIIDSMFYGIIFNESTPYAAAQLFPPDGGYAPFFYGKVVDMFDFPLFLIPEGFPVFGGTYFFPAIFNFADCCVTVGIILMLIFNKKFFK